MIDCSVKSKVKILADDYFAPVGGEILDMVLAQLKPHARIVACGAISQYKCVPLSIPTFQPLLSGP